VDKDAVEEFWTSSRELAHVRAFARARLVAPWAMLGEVLLRVSYLIPPRVTLPPIVGGKASLNTFIAQVGPSGAGKGATVSAARDAFDYDPFPIFEMDAGSGEGVLHAYARYDAKTKIWERYRDAVLIYIPEIDTLAALANRQASTLMSVLRKAWSGEGLTFGYADPAKRPPVEAHSYRLGVSVGVQPDRAAALLDDAGGGTPQRFIWLPMTDPDAPSETPPEPPRKSLARLHWAEGEISLSIPAGVAKLLRTARWGVLTTGTSETSLDGHLLLVRLKVAAVLAIFEGSRVVLDTHWERAGLIIDVSSKTRAGVEQHLAKKLTKLRKAQTLARIEEETTVEQAKHEQAIRRTGAGIMRRLHAAGGQEARHALRRGTSSRDRIHFDEALERLVESGTVVVSKASNQARNGAQTELVTVTS